ncbi:BING4CT-domain-containing protein [Desarmillaria tabescens]|uniref:BING4CT-domain-containing protein n=1 Tax=Armillaria tabescens TaxID=1929756 RepID=A0AA39NL93_ARMTA|nr:BING4CT-domain-containing protein [Desarmillaria tabescens]KAK0467710.1 BING4CT-domain-containing protein [Desarmillaria tabescens]
MDSLIAKADAIGPAGKKRKLRHTSSISGPSTTDRTFQSISKRTSIPKSLQSGATLEGAHSYKHIANKKLRTELSRQSARAVEAKALIEDAELLLTGEAGRMEVEGEMDRTWRVGQDEIVQGAGQEGARGRREWKLEGGPYRSRYTRNGRHLAVVGSKGHVASFDWQAGTLHTELQLQETCRDITYLHDHSHFAVAQKKYVFIYDRDGVELHCLKAHIEPTRMEFLPYHWLLATINGTVTLWTPNLPHPAVQLLAHLGPVASVSMDPSQGGRYMATAGKDQTVKVWDCRNWKGAVREWSARGGYAEVEWSAKGALAVASGGTVNVYTAPTIHNPVHMSTQPPLYMTHPVPHRPLTSLRFAPFQDILTIGHSAGLSSILVPGSGEPNFDSTEADPFENKKARREKEVKALLDKIQPDLITLDPEFVGSLAPPSKLTTETTFDGKPSVEIPFARLPRLERLRVQGKADETEVLSDDSDDEVSGDPEAKKEEREKKKMRGKNKSLKRYLRKQRKNVVDPTAVAIRAKMEKQKEEQRRAKMAAANGGENQKPSALDRFKRNT